MHIIHNYLINYERYTNIIRQCLFFNNSSMCKSYHNLLLVLCYILLYNLITQKILNENTMKIYLIID